MHFTAKLLLQKWTWTALYLSMKTLSMSVWIMVIPLGITKTQTDIKTGYREIQSHPSPF